jgi:lysyl-tRNA synthetase, class II
MDSFRLKKAAEMRARGKTPYAARFDRSATLLETSGMPDGTAVRVAGRLVLWRDMGKVTFGQLQDHTGRLQIALKADTVGEKAYEEALSLIDLGDFIGITGERFTTQKGEPTVLVQEWHMLSKALHQPPEKWHGIADRETAYRQRYLDMMSNAQTRDRMAFRSRFVRSLREFYWKHDFLEVDLPVLVNAASGALAKPFSTHHEALDLDVYLRIALETHQKECLIGGLDRTFSIGPVFRNEGMDPSHLQEFTMCEHYAAYWDYERNMDFTEKMFAHLEDGIPEFGKAMKIPGRDGTLHEIRFKGRWPRIALRDLIKQDSGIDVENHKTADDLRKAIKAKKIQLEVDVEQLGRGTLMDQLYKKVSRPKIISPTFVTEHPTDLSPLSRSNDENPDIADRFQLVIGGWEIVNAYSELVDPVDQAERFETQASAAARGDHEAHRKDDDFVLALSYGCPPCSGWGMGVDRIVALLTQQANLRDVVLFPLMKPVQTVSRTTDAFLAHHESTKKRFPQSPMSTSTSNLLQHADYGHLLPAAHGLLMEHADQTRAHLIATGAAMEALAKHFGGDPQTWKVAGMLHDLDWDKLDKDYAAHCGDTLEHLLQSIEAPAELLGDIRAHYQSQYGGDYPLDTMLRKCLYCVDELTGFIIAVTLVRPSKKIADVEVKSVTKKMKDKAFAAQVDREQILTCEKLLGIAPEEFIGITLKAMQETAAEMGL